MTARTVHALGTSPEEAPSGARISPSAGAVVNGAMTRWENCIGTCSPMTIAKTAATAKGVTIGSVMSAWTAAIDPRSTATPKRVSPGRNR
ncbi:hypothetical protein ON003_13560 [Janibacter hoylei]|uniref:hypothetical protein n=1 Tax=Janibacter hoylei TaxID=364298 RepID=UPI00223831A9|nr:hypothetical protein [Janibacter hoylei]MCW4602520.1 hypothetical protein [Janibacter hoylei]